MKSQQFCLSNIPKGLASGFWIPFEIETICNPNLFATIHNPDWISYPHWVTKHLKKLLSIGDLDHKAVD